MSASTIRQPRLRPALACAVAGLALVGALSLAPGSWGTAAGQTVPGTGPITIPPTGGTITLVTPIGTTIVVRIPSIVLRSLPPGTTLQVSVDLPPGPLSPQEQGSLGGGNTEPVGSPVFVSTFVAQNGTSIDPGSAGDETISVNLPVLRSPQPGQEYAWLVGVYDGEGHFQGYMRLLGDFDPPTNTMRYDLTVRQIQGALLLPALLQPAWVENFDPGTHVWSSPFGDGEDFGVAGDQFTTFRVVGPEVNGRIFVVDPSGHYGWIDADGVGPAGPGG